MISLTSEQQATGDDIPVGLPNLGNTCYLSCILQVMLHTPNVSQSIKRIPSSDFKTLFQQSFKSFYDAMMNRSNDAFQLYSKFVDAATEELSINLHSQQDFFEIFNVIVQRLPKKIQDTWLSSIVSYEFTRNCDQNPQSQYNVEHTRIFEVVLSQNKKRDLEKMMAKHFCHSVKTTEKTVSTYKFFSYSPYVLVLSIPPVNDNWEFSESPFQIETAINISKFVEVHREDDKYELYGVLYHSKNLTHGHYIILLRCSYANYKWYYFNDEVVKTIYGQIPTSIDDMCIVGLFYIEEEEVVIHPPIRRLNRAKEGTFRHGAMDILNTKKPECLQKYIDNAPPIEAITVTPREVNLVEFHPSPFGLRKAPKDRIEQPMQIKAKSKKLYVPTSYDQRNMLQTLYNIHHDDKNSSWYMEKTGIRLSNCKRLLAKIRSGQDITIQKRGGGRARKIDGNYGSVLISTLKKDPFKNLKDLVKQYETDFEGKTISASTIQRYIKKQAKSDGHPIFSFKKALKRAPAANTPENKQIRKKACRLLMSYIQSGFEWVCIDETHFEVGYVDVRGWGEINKRVINSKTIKGFRGSALFGISSTGMQYCLFVRGPVTQEVFNAFIRYLLADIREKENVVVWLDNASIHKKVEEVLGNTNHKVVFNAAYSPDLNPIENVIGIWKGKVKDEVVKFNSESELIELIGKTFSQINPADIRASMEHVRNEVFYKVQNDEDL